MIKRLRLILLVLFPGLLIVNSTAQELNSYEITRLPFSSSGYNDISPVMYNDGLLFCSDRRLSGIMERTSFDGRRLYNIYFVQRRDSVEWNKPKEIRSERSELFNNGPLSIAPDGKTVYFTSEIETGGQSKNKKFRNRSGIFIADLNGFQITSIRPFKYNNPDYNIGQPSVSSDGKYLFFSSDMPGGYGGSDIYYCELINNEWSDPVNAGPMVNSTYIENYPYLHSGGRLYFTSDRPGGAGGLDVYYSEKNDREWGEPVRLPEPVNSASDDFALVAMPDLESGYFASNRQRNDDIYEFIITIIRKATCDTLQENTYCYEFIEENAVKYDTIPFRYEWRFGDGDTASGEIVQHCYAGPGSYLVQLDVVNLVTGEKSLNEKSERLVIQDIEQPFITSPDTAYTGQEIQFSADKTNLPGWQIAKYYWNFDDETAATGQNVKKTFTRPGEYNIQLIVSDKAGSGGKIKETCVSRNILIFNRP
ncbi:MAG TPA: PKD domain-containing protein [Bacteroidales bacterium]|nr:PKD domain-containing protein [Bacteroidales bacterium]